MDFLDRLLDKVEWDVPLFANYIAVGSLKDGNSIAIRQTPSSPEGRYYNGSRVDEFSFQLLVKHQNAQTAINTTQSITDYLDGLTDVVSGDGSFELQNIEVYTLPNWVETTGSKEEVYTALFTALLLREVT